MNVLKSRGIVRIFLAVVVLGAAAKADEIHAAARAGDMDRVKAIVESDPAAVNARNGSGQTPLFDALLGNRPKIAEYLLSKGADVNARNG